MFIQTESTPNPNTLKFLPGQAIANENPINFSSIEKTSISPLARELFEVENIIGVFYGEDFISVTKTEEGNWEVLKPLLLISIMEYLVAKKPIFIDSDINLSSLPENSEDDNELVQQIKELIDTRVRPAVKNDGGDIIFKEYKDGIVRLELHGACSGCPSSTVTLKDGIENMLKYYVPEIISVESV